MSMSKILEGMTEALAIAKGEVPAASITFNGHRYVPATDPQLAISDAIRDHYLSQARSAEQVRRVIAASVTRPARP